VPRSVEGHDTGVFIPFSLHELRDKNPRNKSSEDGVPSERKIGRRHSVQLEQLANPRIEVETADSKAIAGHDASVRTATTSRNGVSTIAPGILG
jgi:hypothetical protein